MEIRQIIEKLAQPGWTIRTNDLGEYDGYEYLLEFSERHDIGNKLSQLIREGWIEGFNGGFRLTDAGHKAYMRSTDELGDGALRPPLESEGKHSHDR